MRLLGLLVAVASMAIVVVLSHAPITDSGADSALLRMSWRLRGEVIESCRPSTPEELARLPQHMRAPEICEGRPSPYRLTATVDREVIIDQLVATSGRRGDLPIMVFLEDPIEPGGHDLRVVFQPTDPASESEPFVLDLRIDPRPGDVVLVTYDADLGRLVARP